MPRLASSLTKLANLRHGWKGDVALLTDVQRFLVGRVREWLVPALVGIVVALVILLQLFWGEDVGLANNGDGGRLWCRFGMEIPQRGGLEFDLEAGTAEVCVQDRSVNRWTFPTSMALFVRGSIAVDALITKTPANYDLRLLGLLGVAGFGILATLAMWAVPGRLLFRATLVGGAFLLWSDIGFVSYLVSYFSEPAAFIGGIGLLLALMRYACSDHFSAMSLIAIVVGGLITVTAKGTLLAVLIPTILIVLVVPIFSSNRSLRVLLLPSMAVVVLLLGAWWSVSRAGEFYSQANEYNAVFSALLDESHDPEADLEEMGLPASLAPWAGTAFFPRSENAASHPDYVQFQEKMTRSAQLEFLIRHPDRMWGMMKRTIESTPDFRISYLGNHEYSAPNGNVLVIADRFDPMTQILQRTRAFVVPLLLVIWTVSIVGGAMAFLRNRMKPAFRALGTAAFFLGSTAMLTALVIPLGDGFMELEKHTLFIAWWTAPLFSSVVIGGSWWVVARLSTRRQGRNGADEHVVHLPSSA